MELYLHYGSDTRDRDTNDRGSVGPRIQGVVGIHQTYDNPPNVFFESPQACEEARLLTGWPLLEGMALTMLRDGDLVSVKAPDGKVTLYGDWGII